MQFEEIVDHLKSLLSDIAVREVENCTPRGIEVDATGLHQLLNFLHTSDQLYFDMLSCITGIDNGPDKNTMEVIYNLYSIPYDLVVQSANSIAWHYLNLNYIGLENPVSDSTDSDLANTAIQLVGHY